MFALSMFVHRVKAHDALPALNPKHVEPVLELEWKRFRQDHSFFVRPVERAMDDVKRSPSPATNVRAKVERSRRNTPRFLFLPVCYHNERQSRKKHLNRFVGVEDGQTMRVNLGVSEVFVTFRVKPSDRFRRENENIHSEVSISIALATLGGEIKAPGIYEDHLLKVSGLDLSRRIRF